MGSTTSPRIVVSIVSHGQGELIGALIGDLAACNETGLSVALTLNVPEVLPFSPADFAVPVSLTRNESPKGFGANHNAAFRASSGEYFCVLNPDVRLKGNPFPFLVPLLNRADVGVAAPMVIDPGGNVEDSARRFPTPVSLFGKLFRSGRGLDYPAMVGPYEPDWVAGMFMLFRREVYIELGGFDERYFLYYEDIDLCARMRLRGKRVMLDPRASVVHDARRASHRNPRHALWHLRSVLRFFATPGYLWLRERPGPQGRAGE